MVAGQFARVAVAAVFPLLIFPPHTHRLLSGPLNFAASPWAACLLAVMIATALPRVLARPLPSGERSD
jgi:hypothetical protein